MDDSEVVRALATVLDARTTYVWSESTPYTPDQIGIYYGAIPATPDRAIGLTLYDGGDDPQTGLAHRRVQVLFRGARNSLSGANDMASEVFRVLQRFCGAGFASVSRLSMAPLGADDSQRQERVDNYLIVLDNALSGIPE